MQPPPPVPAPVPDEPPARRGAGLSLWGVAAFISGGLSLAVSGLDRLRETSDWHFRQGSWPDVGVFYLQREGKMVAVILVLAAIKAGFWAFHAGGVMVWRLVPILLALAALFVWTRQFLFKDHGFG